MGASPEPRGQTPSRTICVRVTTEEAATIAEQARAARLTKGGYIRRRGDAPAREHSTGARVFRSSKGQSPSPAPLYDQG